MSSRSICDRQTKRAMNKMYPMFALDSAKGKMFTNRYLQLYPTYKTSLGSIERSSRVPVRLAREEHSSESIESCHR